MIRSRQRLFSPQLTVLCLVLGLLPACFTVSALAHAPSLTPALRQFKVAWMRVEQGQPDQVDPPAVKALPIYPYLVAARLERDLSGKPSPAIDTQVQAFLKAHQNQPVTRELTADWLQSLAQRHEWQMLVAHYDPARADSVLRCQWLQARIETGHLKGLIAAIGHSYLVGHSEPECAGAFSWLKQQGGLPDSVVEQRTKLALSEGHTDFARQLIAGLPVTEAKPLLQWGLLIDAPEHSLKRLIGHPRIPVSDNALEDGWFRLVRKDPDVALDLYPKLLAARKLYGARARPFTRDLALGLAWNRQPQAIDYFKRFTPTQDDTRALTWRVRAALWARNWHYAKKWIADLPEMLRDEPEWQYWRARADGQTEHPRAARIIYERLAGLDGYYALLASWRLNRRYAPQPSSLVRRPQLLKELAVKPGIRRAHELFEVGLQPQAITEWQAALGKASPDQELQAIRLARQWGWYDEAVDTATQQGVLEAYRLLYPLPYLHVVHEAARRYGLPIKWLYGVIRQESLYNPKAVSPAGALGLMQLRLPTAISIAKCYQLPLPGNAKALFDPKINVVLGTAHLKALMDRENDLVVALAAYNAGHEAAEHWLPQHSMAADVWIENIPYDETRQYVKSVLWHITVFGWRRTGAAQSIAARMANIKSSAQQLAARNQ